MLLSELQVREVTLKAAEALKASCPWVNFTSGRRNWREQAHAMAVNTVKNRQFCGTTYRREPEIQALINAHPEITDVTGLTNLIESGLDRLPSQLRDRFAHPAGRAFDLAQPGPQYQESTRLSIRSLVGLEVFLEGEAGLPIWHLQFHETSE